MLRRSLASFGLVFLLGTLFCSSAEAQPCNQYHAYHSRVQDEWYDDIYIYFSLPRGARYPTPYGATTTVLSS